MAAGEVALRDDELPTDLVRRALAAQRGRTDGRAPDVRATALVRRTQLLLRAAEDAST